MKLPLASVFFTAAAIASPMAASALEDIPTTAINNGSFTTLVAALGAADLVEALSMSGPYTVFAPTDDAFDDLPDGLVTCLLKPEYDDVLKDILTYHVAPGRAFAGDIANGQMIVTLFDEETVLVSKDSSGVQINNANVVIPDVEATNGVIHAIDSVLVPESIDVIAFLDNCQEADQLQITDEVTCSYLGMSRSAGNWLRGPTVRYYKQSEGSIEYICISVQRISTLCYLSPICITHISHYSSKLMHANSLVINSTRACAMAMVTGPAVTETMTVGT